MSLDQDDDFVGKQALLKIREECANRRLVGVEIAGEPLQGSDEHFWKVLSGSEMVGHVTRCVYSPRLKKNIGWANVAIEFSEVGTELTLETPDGALDATVCKAPWIKSKKKFPALD